MSFKRDGDDPLLFSRLQHKRVAELLGEHVPEDEAKLLSNGRLTCLICSHRPIFDTMKILVIHRKGKKHTAELHKYLGHKQKLELREAKKIQRESVRKQNQLNSEILGSSCIPPLSHNSKTIYKKKAIDITSKNPFGISTPPSASSQVRKYLKEISRKTPLAKVVEEQRRLTVSENNIEKDKKVEPATSQTLPHSSATSLTSSSSLLSIHMSGWVRDKFGNLVKDPEAEFDSSEEET